MVEHPAPDQLPYQPMTKFKPLPSQQELHRLFDYSVVTGELYWKVMLSSRGTVGSVVGKKNTGRGYKRLRINNVEYAQHRIIWCWVTGEDPAELEIDHKNNQRDCNAWHNLRKANRSQNTANTPGAKGFQKNEWGRYHARIYKDNKFISLGMYATKAEARAAYEKASRDLHGEFSSVK